jgi:hypothetical protein
MFGRTLPKVQFLAGEEYVGAIPNPAPASKFLPSWYKNMHSYANFDGSKTDKKVVSRSGVIENHSTMKRCVPVSDMLTSGYIIPLWMDIVVRSDDHSLDMNWDVSDSRVGVSSHPLWQVMGTPLEAKTSNGVLPKLLSPWRIKTPKGYSCMFTPPPYQTPDIEILPAIVDTDTMHEINFPFIYKGEKGDSIINRGTPLIHVFPFKRETWKSETTSISPVEILKEDRAIQSVVYNFYRRFLHTKKKYL